MSRLTTYMTCMDKEVHEQSYKCSQFIEDTLGIKIPRCTGWKCFSCAYFKYIPFEVEAKLNHKE